MNTFLRFARSGFYMVNVMWSGFLIIDSYTKNSDVGTAFITVCILFGSMIFNDLIKER